MTNSISRGRRRRHLSLTWKAVALLSFGLIALNAAFFMLNSQSLQRQSELHKQAAYQRHSQELEGLFWESSYRFQRLGEIVPSLTGIRAALSHEDRERLAQAFEPHWSTLNLDMGIDLVTFYDAFGESLGSWHIVPCDPPTAALIQEWALRVSEAERPFSTIYCGLECIQFAVLPVLAEGETIGTIVFGRLLADVVLAVHKVFGTDIGILVPDAKKGRTGTDTFIPAWNARVVALTNEQRNLELLKKLAVGGRSLHPENTGWTVHHDGRDLDINLIPLPGIESPVSPVIAVIADISESMSQIRHAVQANALVGILGLIASETLLLAMLWRPMSRIHRTATILPLLAEHAFEKVRAAISDRSRRWLADEIDVLDDTAVFLSYELEKLEADVANHNRALADKMDELAREKERYALAAQGANDGLWDWDLRADTVYYSPRWKAMLGGGEEEINDSPSDWLDRIHPDDIDQVRTQIDAHRRGFTSHFQCEYRLLQRDGSYRWMLSRALAVRDKGGVVYRMAGSQTDITERKRAQEQLIHDALHDALTGLPNRPLFMDRLGQAMRHAKLTSDYRVAVLFLDVDSFKTINDSLGHVIGDQLIIGIARRLEGCLRPSDTVARLGGDEFTALLDGIENLDEAKALVEQMQTVLRRPLMLENQEVSVTVSIGIALGDPRYERPEDMLRDADNAMYRAKALGRGRYEVFNRAMHVRAVSLLKLVNDLRRSIEREEFQLHYQPIISFATGRLMGFEALVRWSHPERGSVSPAEFIAVSEEMGLIIPLGRWIIREACHQVSQWRKRFPLTPPFSVNVNLSGKQLSVPGYFNDVREIVEATGVRPESLKIEITESAIMENAEYAIGFLTRVKKLGIELCIDDFGTGYSSLSYLHRFPFDVLKVDRSFLTGPAADKGDWSIMNAIVTLAHSLGMKVVVEGIETQEQAARLRDLGCEMGQGYFFSRPVDVTAAEVMIGELIAGVQTDKLAGFGSSATPGRAI